MKYGCENLEDTWVTFWGFLALICKKENNSALLI